jgi:hypothetical protein
MPNVFDSSTVTTPSLPTLSMASARPRRSPESAAEMRATWAISELSSISLACSAMASTAAATAFSMPRLSAIGLAPAATLRRPSRTSAWASTVAVVVPSPAMSLVLVATSFTSWAPMFSNGSSSSISRAIDTPSLVMVGAPELLVEAPRCGPWAERDLDGVGQLVDAGLEGASCVVVELQDLGHVVTTSRSRGRHGP